MWNGFGSKDWENLSTKKKKKCLGRLKKWSTEGEMIGKDKIWCLGQKQQRIPIHWLLDGKEFDWQNLGSNDLNILNWLIGYMKK